MLDANPRIFALLAFYVWLATLATGLSQAGNRPAAPVEPAFEAVNALSLEDE